jgi:thiamine pyrophosphate-dependent acetolactate synthase large subunit-like protein
MVAMSMADGYARLTGIPQCVLVHVDVGTQGLGAAMHNASVGRAPVLVFAGLSPYTQDGEERGSRTEYIHWLQDVPDQKQIVAQYCRYTGELKTSKNVKQIVNRALQFAISDPAGPVYLVGAREVLEQELTPYQVEQSHWRAVNPSALPQDGVETISQHLVDATSPLVVVGYSGRHERGVTELIRLANILPGLRVLDTGICDMCFPADHPGSLGCSYGVHPAIESADVILVIDCDVPWIPSRCKPSASAKIFHIDVDPLKERIPVFYIPSQATYRADAGTALKQINDYISSRDDFMRVLATADHVERRTAREVAHSKRLQTLAAEAAAPPEPDSFLNASYLLSQLRKSCPVDTIWCVEAVTLAMTVADQIQANLPKSWINCGGGGLGWSGGAALGIKLATDEQQGGPGRGRFVVQVVGDGTYLFSVPGSVYWIARRYQIPVLTIVLNNKGWNAPRRSLLLVHPNGLGSQATNEDINISFAPSPDYSGIAKAAAGGELWAGCASTVEELGKLLPEAVQSVLNGKGAVLEAQLDGKDGKYVPNRN